MINFLIIKTQFHLKLQLTTEKRDVDRLHYGTNTSDITKAVDWPLDERD